MDKQLNPTLKIEYNYLPIILKLTHVSKRGSCTRVLH